VRLDRVVLLCGRYEGVDERVAETIADQELSIGDYVLSGGELGAAIVVDAVTRLVPGVLGNAASAQFESFGAADSLLPVAREGAPPSSTHGAGGLLDYPHYTRPAEFRGVAAPEVLTSGDHEQVRRWRRLQSLLKTARNRPDLLSQADLTDDERAVASKLLTP
jgi:tRNA (guanine37-N1)-methyltransferase